jgi:NAD(P)H-flavin reductase
LNPHGKLTPIFWNKDLTGTTFDLMGPLGLNTADKMHHSTIYLFGFGVGAGVIRSLAEYFKDREDIQRLTIVTGSRTEDDIIHKQDFDRLPEISPKIKVSYVVSTPPENSSLLKGYIQHHIDHLDFNHADVFVCGLQIACEELVEKIKAKKPNDCSFFIEGFH